MAEIHLDPRTRREVDPDLLRLQDRINHDFDFEEVVAEIFSLLERRTNLRGCRLSVLGRDLNKRLLVESATMPKKGKTRRCPILSYPLPLTNDEIRHTLDIYAFEAAQLNLPESDVLERCLDLLYQSVNKDYHERDYLTGLYNRRGLEPRLARFFAEAKRDEKPAAVLMLDLDHFKKVNDAYGHPVGDLVLFEFAGLLADVAAGFLAGRWGGEEFVVVFPDADRDPALAAAEDIRAKTEKLKIWVDKSAGKFVSPTCSIGVALFPRHADEVETLIHFADVALYEAKNGGRNRVELYPLDAPDVRLRKLGAAVEREPVPLRDLESECEIISLKSRDLVKGFPLAVAVAGPRLFILDGQTKKVYVYDGAAKKFAAEFGGPGDEPHQLEGPVDLAVSPDGLVLVVDAPDHVVKMFDASRGFVGFIGGRDAEGAPILGYIKGTFNEPVAVSVDGEGRILVAERMNRRVQRFTAAGEFDGLEVPLDAADVAPPYQPDPRDVAADGAGNIYVLDAGNSVVQKFDADGHYVKALGGPGPAAGAGRFKGITALAVDREGSLAAKLGEAGVAIPGGASEAVVTAEAGDVNRLQFFGPDGTFLGLLDFAKIGLKFGNPVRPGRLTVTARGNIYLVDQENADILQLSFAGESY